MNTGPPGRAKDREKGQHMDRLILNAEREGYALAQVRGTMTVGELAEFLEDFAEDTPVYLSFDRGYTFGGIRAGSFGLLEDEDDEEEEEDDE